MAYRYYMLPKMVLTIQYYYYGHEKYQNLPWSAVEVHLIQSQKPSDCVSHQGGDSLAATKQTISYKGNKDCSSKNKNRTLIHN